MKFETKLISGILIATAASIALIAGLTFLLVPGNQGKEMNAVQHTLFGNVVDAQSQAIADAQVTIHRQDLIQANSPQSMSDDSGLKTAITDDNGKFKIESISSGTYTHKVEADGYKALKQQVTITKDKNLTIKLEPDHK